MATSGQKDLWHAYNHEMSASKENRDMLVCGTSSSKLEPRGTVRLTDMRPRDDDTSAVLDSELFSETGIISQRGVWSRPRVGRGKAGGKWGEGIPWEEGSYG